MSLDKTTRILIVDDFPMMLELVRFHLASLEFHRVEQAAGGLDALRLLYAMGDFGLVISDWHMSPLSGLGLLEEMRADPVLAHIPFVLLLDSASQDEVMAARKAGVSAFVMKPISKDLLSIAIAIALAHPAI